MFTIHDAGCHADGSFGNDHVRNVIARLLERLYRDHPREGSNNGLHWPEVAPIVEALDGDMSDDAWEEIEGLQWLNDLCEEGCHFDRVDGDLVLLADDDEG